MIITHPQTINVRRLFIISVLLLLSFCFNDARAQSLLNRQVSVNFNRAPLGEVLKQIGKNGNCYFSYDAKLLPQDSLVTIIAADQKIAVILGILFQDKYQVTEYNGYIILTKPIPHLSLANIDVTNEDNAYSISGLVVNERTGERLMNASVYLKQLLVSALTDEHGYFRLKFRADNPGQISLTASKLDYKDTSINFLQSVSISTRALKENYDKAGKRRQVEKTGMGRFLISTSQRIQSLNIPDFFATRPFQVSLTPGLSSHGMFSSQVINNFSVNLIGGYTAGVNGVEVAGLFNINKMNSRYLQLAGVFNLVGGTVTGLQVAGINNQALDTVKGAQLAFFVNKAKSDVAGVQVSLFNNSARKLKGLQIGLVNTADTSLGASIGLVNIIGNGFYKIGLATSDLMNTNAFLTTGTHSFYSKLSLGANISPGNKLYAFGLGIGHDFMFTNNVFLAAETHYLIANAGNWDDRLIQAKLLLNVQLSKHIGIMAGPVFNSYNYSNSFSIPGYKNPVHAPTYPSYVYGHQVRSWMGWEAGLAFNSIFKPAKKVLDDSNAWYLGAAATTGVGWDNPYGGFVHGTELIALRDLGSHLTGTLSAGYTYFTVHNDYYYQTVDDTHQVKLPGNSSPRQFIPVKVGVRLKTGGPFYIGCELGEAFGLFETYHDPNIIIPGHNLVDGPYRSSMYSVSAGFSFKNGLETGVKFDNYNYTFKQFALRLGYRIKLSK
jgi:hypothetical protein